MRKNSLFFKKPINEIEFLDSNEHSGNDDDYSSSESALMDSDEMENLINE